MSKRKAPKKNDQDRQMTFEELMDRHIEEQGEVAHQYFDAMEQGDLERAQHLSDYASVLRAEYFKAQMAHPGANQYIRSLVLKMKAAVKAQPLFSGRS